MGKLKHGHARRGAKTRAYLAWESMLRRCYNPRQPGFDRYGGAGIGVCARWQNYSGFKADMGDCRAGHSLDRIDNDRGYEPGNCRWVPMAAQASNKRSNHRLTHDGRTMPIAAWARHLGLSERTLRSRIVDCGWTVERALTTPLISAADRARMAVESRVARRRRAQIGGAGL